MHTYSRLEGSVCRCMLCARMRHAKRAQQAWLKRPEAMAEAETTLVRAKVALDVAIEAERAARNAKEAIIEEVNA